MVQENIINSREQTFIKSPSLPWQQRVSALFESGSSLLSLLKPDEIDELTQQVESFKNMPDRLKIEVHGTSSIERYRMSMFLDIFQKRLKNVQEKYQKIGEARKCLQELKLVSPNREFQSLTLEGSSGKIFIDPKQPNKLYKVSIEPISETDQRELQNFKKLTNTKLIPKLYGHTLTPNKHSVIAMERVNYVEIYQVSRDVRERLAPKITSILEKANLYPADVEFVFDTDSQLVKIIDVAGLVDQSKIPQSIENRVRELLLIDD